MNLPYKSFEQELFFKLPTGDARSIKSLEFATELFKLIEVPKTYISDFRRIYSDIGNSVYMFLSHETKEIFLTTHFAPEDVFEWDVCLIATFSTNKMSRAFAEYLEYLVSSLIEQSEKYSVRNKRNIAEPNVSESVKITCEAKIGFLNILLTALKFDLFLKAGQSKQANTSSISNDIKPELVTAIQADVGKQHQSLSITPLSKLNSPVDLTSADSSNPTKTSYDNKTPCRSSTLEETASTVDTRKTQGLPVGKRKECKQKRSVTASYRRAVFNDLYFICQNKKYNAYAIATYNPYTNEVTVLEGSKFSLERPNTSLGKHDRRRKTALIKSGKLVNKGDYFELIEDYVFSSPSQASSIILNYTTNGKDYWRTSRDCKLGVYINNLANKDEDDSMYKSSHPESRTPKEHNSIDTHSLKPSTFFCQYDSKNVFAEGDYDPITKKITVKKGSTFSLSMIGSLIGGQAERERKKMIREGVLSLDDGCYTLTKDYVFRNVSRASEVVIGSGYGRKAWVHKNGLHIGEYY